MLWLTSLAVLFGTNRHQRAAVHYLVASVIALPIAYVMLEAWGLDGAALALVLLESYMLVVVLRQALPAAHDTLRGWLGALIRPPTFIVSRHRAQAGSAATPPGIGEQAPFME